MVRRAPRPTSGSATVQTLEARRLLSSAGLTAAYFHNDDFTNPAATRTDANVNFDWGTGAPVAGMDGDTFSIRWQGLIAAPTTEQYTFYLSDDDGVRLWIDGALVVDRWHAAGHATITATVPMKAGQRVGVLIESKEDTGHAGTRLEWSSPTYGRHVVPTGNLRPLVTPAQTLKIIALGDSVTEGQVGFASYRFWLDRKLRAAGYNVDFVGTRSGNHNGYAPNGNSKYHWFDQDHQSRWGAKLDELRASMGEWAGTKPDVALIHIGHNDIRGGKSSQQLITELGAFVDELRQVNPNIRIALAKPIKNTSLGYVAEMDAYRALIPGLAATKNSGASPVVVVDQYEGFDPITDTYDTVHPNEAGEKKIARRFHGAVRQLVGQPPHQQGSAGANTNLKGIVFNDLNGNGRQDAGEAGIGGRFLYLDLNDNGRRDAGEQVAASKASGWYMFQTLPVGTYRVRHHTGVAGAIESTTPVVRNVSLPTAAIFNFGLRIR